MNDTHEIEISLAHAKKLVERKNMVEKLFGNREFKALVSEGYFKDEAVRLVALLGDPSMQNNRPDIIRSMDGISELQTYFRTVIRMGQMAETEVQDNQAALDEAAAADADNE